MNNDFDSQNSMKQIVSLDEVTQNLDRYYRKTRLVTYLIPIGFVILFSSAFLFLIFGGVVIGLGFGSITCGMIGTWVMFVKTRKYAKENCVEPMLREELESLTFYDGKEYGRYNKHRTTLDILDMQCIVEYLNLLSDGWWYCMVSDQLSGRINGHDFSFGDVDLQTQSNKAMVSLFKGQIFIYPLKNAIVMDYMVGIEPVSGEIIVRPFIGKSGKETNNIDCTDYNILREIGDGHDGEPLDVLGNVVDIDRFKNGIRELKEVAHAPFLVYFIGHSMILVVQSGKDVLEIGTRGRIPKNQHENHDFAPENEDKGAAATVKNAWELQKGLMKPGMLMQLYGFGPIENIIDTCRSDSAWIASVAYTASKMC